MFKPFGWMLALVLSAAIAPGLLNAAGGGNSGGGGGGGGGGSVKPLEIRVTGYITAIDYEHGIITVGAAYYNTGSAFVTTSTKVSLDNVACSFDDLVVGDWAEMRYDWYTKVATKISGISL